MTATDADAEPAGSEFPLFTSTSFPIEYIDYRVPLSKAAKGRQTFVLFSVDWEKDHGRWRTGNKPSYFGIRLGTQALGSMLDRLGVPCTWFVECNSQHPALDMLRSCQPEFEAIRSRSPDEIGLHVHWGNFFGRTGGTIDLRDFSWLESEITQSTQVLSQGAGRQVASFRSGGHTLVPGLPGLLERLGYKADCSVEDRRRPVFRYVQGLLGWGVSPYAPDRAWANLRGQSNLLEIPTSLHLHDFSKLQRRIERFLIRGCVNVLSLYVHIDELTRPGKAGLDPERLAGVEGVLTRLSQIPGVEFHTVSSYLATVGPHRQDN